jgi:hypothetical protein
VGSLYEERKVKRREIAGCGVESGIGINTGINNIDIYNI